MTKEKPDLLFNNPLKQKVFMFLKNNPGKDYETFQVLVADAFVSRQHFTEVEQAIKSREEREAPREVRSEITNLFLNGTTFNKPKPANTYGFVDHPEAKEMTLKKM